MKKRILFTIVLLSMGAFMCPSAFGGKGYWDLFSVTLIPKPNSEYWKLVEGGSGALTDPLESPDCAGVAVIDKTTPLGGIGWFFGGYDWGTHTLEGNAGKYVIELKGPGKYTLNVILDTNTRPCNNGAYGSWGTVKNIKVKARTAAGWITQPVLWTTSPLSPVGGTVVSQTDGGKTSEIKLGFLDFGDKEFSGQAKGIYGASAQLPYAAGYCITFETDLKTWDSYNLSNTKPTPAYDNSGPLVVGCSYCAIDVNTIDINDINDTNEPPPPPQEKIKWSQVPDLNYTGLDVDATHYVLADDFECNSPKPITDIHIWGSWMSDRLPFGDYCEPNVGDPCAVKFTLSIHSDNPNGQNGWSEPNQQLWTKVFTKGQFKAEPYFATEYPTEGWYGPGSGYYFLCSDKVCWKYDFYMSKDDIFWQQGEPCYPVTYWLNVKAEPCDINAVFGWKTSKQHWNDDAVWSNGHFGPWTEIRYPLTHPYCPNSIDLAFEITTSGDPCNPDPAADLGDAPDSNNSGITMTAYPGVIANYPTIYEACSPPAGPIHWQPKDAAYLGLAVSLELEADTGQDEDGLNNITPANNSANQDGNDDGVLNMPLSLPHCQFTSFDYLVNVVNPNFGMLYVNVWFDWNRDGDWDDTLTCGTKRASEWAVRNQILFNLPIGLNQITTPGFRCWHPTPSINGPIWMRITLAEKMWTGQNYAGMVGNGGSGAPGGYNYGETEDYYFTPDQSPQGGSACCVGDLDLNGFINFYDFAVFADNWLTSP